MSKEPKQKKLAVLIIGVVATAIVILNVGQITFIAETTSAAITKNYEEECHELTSAYSDRLSGKILGRRTVRKRRFRKKTDLQMRNIGYNRRRTVLPGGKENESGCDHTEKRRRAAP